jgi:tRNA A37 N6-isopentenylltransferase MiaA
MRNKIVVVCGPTASGKTALSIALAKAFDGEVVSADSMQIYRRMDIGTAKPSLEERDGVPHYMLDVADPGEPYSVARYAKEAGDCVEDILSRGKLPIVCGGTGLYIDGLLRGAEFQPSGADNGLREQLEGEWDAHGPEHMMARLAAVDPESAARPSATASRGAPRQDAFTPVTPPIILSIPSSKAPPPARRIPVSKTSCTQSAGILVIVSQTPSIRAAIGSSRAVNISSEEMRTVQ